MSFCTFLIVLCTNFIVELSSSVDNFASAVNNLSAFSKNLLTQIIPLLSQGAASLNSAIYISYNLKLSAQNSSTISSGLTTFFKLLDIFDTILSTSSPVSISKYFPSLSSTKSFANNHPFFLW